jgi:MerR family transcriptional regulator/heat shock protein HspR
MSYYQETHAVYVISVAAELAGMHAQTLRMYERRGLLSPSRTAGGSRRYSDFDVSRLRRIAELTDSGLNLEGVRRVIQLEEENARLRDEIEQLKRRYSRELVPFGQFSFLLGQK